MTRVIVSINVCHGSWLRGVENLERRLHFLFHVYYSMDPPVLILPILLLLVKIPVLYIFAIDPCCVPLLCQRPHDCQAPRLIDKVRILRRQCPSPSILRSLHSQERKLVRSSNMLVQESHHDVPTTADGQGTMRTCAHRHCPGTLCS